MKFSHLWSLMVLLTVSSGLQAAEKLPNILILYGDDLGYGDLGCYNKDSKIPTPHLDKLAEQGMRFTDGHSSSGICTPSRYALLTGRHHWRKFHGIVNALGKSVFDKERLTLPDMLKEKGYETGAIGKWHLGWDWNSIRKPASEQPKPAKQAEAAKPAKPAKPAKGKGKKRKKKPAAHFSAFNWDKPIADGPLNHGFDYYFGDTVINFPPYCWIENDKVVNAPDTMMDESKWPAIKEGRWECRPGPMYSGWNPYDNIPDTTRKGVEFISRAAKSDKPFFLYFAYPSPHAPIIPNDQFDGKSKAGPYGDFVYETDDSIGQLLKALETTGQAENTLVIFSADNGPEKYAYARDQKFGHWSAWPLRGLKRDIYEGGHRVPYIVKWPGKVPAGKVNDSLMSQIDIMATVAAAVGYDLPDNAAEDSHNQLDVWTGKTEKGPRTTHIHNTHSKAFAIRDGDWVLVDAAEGYHSGRVKDWEARHKYLMDKDVQGQLFNLKDDLGQRKNIFKDHPEKAKALKSLLTKIRTQGYSAPRLSK